MVRETPRGTSRQAGLIRAGALSQWGVRRVGTTVAGGAKTGLSTPGSPGSVACAISNPGLVTGYTRTGGDAPRAVICPGRALHDLSSLLLPAPSRRARLAIRRIRAYRTHKEGLSCPDPSAASASHCQHH